MVEPPPEKLTPELVFREYAPRIYNLARRMLGNDADAEDVTQDVLLQVVRKLPTFRGEAAFPTWLHRVTVNTALSHRRRQAVRQDRGLATSFGVVGADEPVAEVAPDRLPGPEEQILSRETQQLIERAIDRLP